MFVFGCVISDEDEYDRWAGPTIKAVSEPDTRIDLRRGQDCIFRAYNDILAAAAPSPELEGVVLLHQDVEILDPELLAKLRRRFADPDIGIVGAIGGVGAHSMCWWECPESHGRVVWDWLMDDSKQHLFMPADFLMSPGRPSAQVDLVDGLLLALSARAARELRFDESLGPGFHGYDADICLQAKKQGLEVHAEEMELVHHNDAGLSDRAEWERAHIAFGRKWIL